MTTLQNNRLLLSILGPIWIRRIMGILGMALPVMLYLGNGMKVLDSLSAYWYSDMKWVFVGSLILFGWMLIAYKGHSGTADDKASTVAGLCAIGVGVFRTSLDYPPDLIGWIHYGSALLFFIILSIMSIFMFTKGYGSNIKKLIYILCGIGMLISILLMFFSVITENAFFGSSTVFILETAAIEFFGLSWLTKGFNKR
ncbi:MAG: hypothetical protein INQ03_01030 [Candidatus Heimdallarchaeota archaeon]|nr:hypothetical protein [Candidatus Heimdallarchaeota archaeon]